MRTKNLLLLIIGIFILKNSWGQQQAMFSQYMSNGLVLNPGYAGSHESISATALARSQWVGIDGAPRTQTLSVHSPVPNRNIALGATFIHDELGVTSENSFFLSYAYRIATPTGTFSVGLQAGFRRMNINYSALETSDPNLQATVSGTLPNFGAGVYYYSKRFFAGVSVPTVIENRLKGTLNKSTAPEELETTQLRHFFATTGYVFDLSPIIKIKPSLLIKSVIGAPIDFDLNASIIINDRIWFGASFRSFENVNFLVDLQVNPAIKVGYAYDYTTSELIEVSSGSHEFMVNYRLVPSDSKALTPRYF